MDLGRLVEGLDDVTALLALLLDVVDLRAEVATRRGRRGRPRPRGELDRADGGAVVGVAWGRVDRPGLASLVGGQERRRVALVDHGARGRGQVRQRRTAVVAQHTQLRIGVEDVRSGWQLDDVRVRANGLDEVEGEIEPESGRGVGRLGRFDAGALVDVAGSAVSRVVGHDRAAHGRVHRVLVAVVAFAELVGV